MGVPGGRPASPSGSLAQKILRIPGIEVQQGERIRVETEPPGVAVFVDGLFEGNGPVTVRVPRPGKYAWSQAGRRGVQNPGPRTWSVDANSTFFVKAQLLRQEKVVDERVRALQDGPDRPAHLRDPLLRRRLGGPAVRLPDRKIRGFASDSCPRGPPTLALLRGACRPRRGPSHERRPDLHDRFEHPLGAAPGASRRPACSEPRRVRIPGSCDPRSRSASWPAACCAAACQPTSPRGAEPCPGLPEPGSSAWAPCCGAFLGLGVPYVLGAGIPRGGLPSGMLTRFPVAGSATALWLTRDFTEGRNIVAWPWGPYWRRAREPASLGLPCARLTAVLGPGRRTGGRRLGHVRITPGEGAVLGSRVNKTAPPMAGAVASPLDAANSRDCLEPQEGLELEHQGAGGGRALAPGAAGCSRP
ncbi:MAG: hypothetical protein MZU95_09270 [Desulfomicrobium escambiense]|nr:hypothetical protein [Desulfomicrobium escambiense]